MIEVVLFERKHLYMFRPGKFDAEIYDWRFQEYMANNLGNGLTAIINGKVMGCMFMTQPVEGCSTVMIFACDEVREKHWLWLGLAFRRGLKIVPKNLGITKLRAEVLNDFRQSRRWIERMGFAVIGQDNFRTVYERAV